MLFPPNILSKQPIPSSLPRCIDQQIKKCLTQSSDDRIKFLRCVSEFLEQKYCGHRLNVITKLPRLWLRDLKQICNTQGFLYCTTMNYILRVMSVNSGLFQDDDIKLKWTHTWYIMPHQYLQFNINGKYLSVDVWNHQFGTKFGEVGTGFSNTSWKSKHTCD